MKFNYFYLFILLLEFIIILYVFLKLYGTNIKKFIPYNLYTVYIYSTFICIITFLLFVYYLLIKNDFLQNTINNIFFSIFCMLLGLGLWIISTYYSKKNYIPYILSILCVLFIIISNIYLLYIVSYIDETKYKLLKQISLITVFYLLFHHIVIDLILWNII
jgi:hypothetical protein